MSFLRNKWTGAQKSFFNHGLTSTEIPWSGTIRSIVYACAGLAVINQVCRGNIWGETTEKSEVYVPMPILRVAARQKPASTDGFVGDDAEVKSHATDGSHR